MKKCFCTLFLIILSTGTSLIFHAPLVSDLDLAIGSGTPTFSRVTAGTVQDYNGNVVTCDIEEARYKGARRVHGVTTAYPNGRWSAYEAENAIEFDGVDDDILVPDDTTIQNIFDGGGTISFWVKPKSDGELDLGRILDKTGGSFTAGYTIVVRDESSGLMKLRLQQNFSGTNGIWNLVSREIPINQWVFIAIVYNSTSDSNTPTFYINTDVKTVGSGIAEASTPVGTRASDVGSDLYIGNRSGGATAFDGSIDNIKIWKGVELTETDVQNEYYGTTSMNRSSISYPALKTNNYTEELALSGWWKLDDTDSSITDYSGNGNTGTFRDNTTPATPVNVDGVYDTSDILTTLRGVLIEEERTNEVDYSEALDNATGGWLEANVTVTLNQAIGPDGATVNATKIVPDVGTGLKSLSKTISGLTDDTVYTTSVFAKKNDFQWVYILTRIKDSSSVSTWFDLTNGVVGTKNHTYADIEEFNDSWYRISVGINIGTAGVEFIARYRISDADDNINATGDGSKYNLFFGAQVEEGNFASSYIAATGAATTRVKDELQYQAEDNFNEVKGSVVYDFNLVGLDAGEFPGLLTIAKDTSNQYSTYAIATNGALYYIVQTGSVQALLYSAIGALVPGTNQSIGFTYKTDFAEGFIDGSSFGTDTDGATLPTGITTIYIGSNASGNNQANGVLKNVRIYNTVLSEYNMESLTVWNLWDTWGR